ncbi:hypothetical protein BDA99DRAFT_562643 [Phascolomyces articulosus]|uniref:Uncharacterized protein n=1 Tax=Phascolomyces articulosus TaxID=60185 RepID=A0AAD5PCN2_9FUNG|nr:hypothetical protein BDA99DRAFT_562643 [Phascolomyces articulosus]
MINETLGRTEYHQQQRSQPDLLDSTTLSGSVSNMNLSVHNNMNMADETQQLKKTPKERISMFFKKEKASRKSKEEEEELQHKQYDFLVDSSVFLDSNNSTSVYDHQYYATQNWNKSHAPPPLHSSLDHHHLSQLSTSPMTTSTIENEQNHINNNSKPSSPVAEKAENLGRQASVRSSTGGLPPTPTPSQQQQQSPPQQPSSTPTPEEDGNARLLAQLKAELARQRYCYENLEIERQQYKLDGRALNDRITKVKERLQEKQVAKEQLEGNYKDHLKTLRATDDDLTSVANKLKEMRRLIANLADDLVDNVDPKRATSALRTFWINLKQPIEKMGSPLPLNRIRMLTEKYMMDYLIPNLTPNTIPGLAVIRDYSRLEYWLRNHNVYMSIRLRQEIAKCIVGDGQRLLAKEIKSKTQGLYTNLNEAYPYMKQFDDNESDPEKTYETKVRKLVEYSIGLGFAMKGQEVDIVPAVVQEGVQPFNPGTMVDEESLKEGIIEFCICPPFIIYDNYQNNVLEKGRVFCLAPIRRT